MKKNTKGLDNLIKSLRKMGGMKLEWGFFEEDTYEEDRGEESVPKVAALVEEGHDNGGLFPNTTTPPRPFFQTSVEDESNHAELRRAIKNLQRKVLQGKISPEDKMEALGNIVVKQLQESIENFGGGVEKSTLDMREWRGSSSKDPLVESGTLLDSVKFKIREV